MTAGATGLDRRLFADPPLNLRDVPTTELRRTLGRRRSALTTDSKGTA